MIPGGSPARAKRPRFRRLLWLLPASLALAAGSALLGGKTRPRAPADYPVPFVDVAAKVGIDFRTGHSNRLLNILETAGSGCAFLDYDRDGYLDLLFVAKDQCRLFHNTGRGTFEDVTAAMGLAQAGHWIGCAVGDYDNDGYPDLFLNGYGCVRLLHNEHGKGFTDVTEPAGLSSLATAEGGMPAFGVSAAWVDVDGDGWLDLYVARYVAFKRGMKEFCRSHSGYLQTCGPKEYAGQRGVLLRNLGGRRFVDVTRLMGADRVHGKAWGVTCFDYNGDGWPDLYIANDEQPGDLLENLHGHGFKNVALEAGAAFDSDGRPHGAMGVDAGDFNGDGRMGLVVTTFVNEPNSLYRNNDQRTFTDVGVPAGIGVPTAPRVGWGTKFFDYDNDGWLDLLFINGHATDSSLHPDARSDMAQPAQLFRNRGGSFVPVPLGAAGAPIVGRGAAFGDYDNDGFPDVAVVDMEGRAQLLHNEEGARPGHAHWLGLSLVGSRSNRLGLGARVTLRGGGRTQTAEAQTCGSVFSASDPRVRFGLGQSRDVEEVVVRWPSGVTDRLARPPVDRYLELREGQTGGPAKAAR